MIAVTTRCSHSLIRSYIDEVSRDSALREHVSSLSSEGPNASRSDSEPHFGRRIGWYAFARVLKPRLVVETGVDKGLGSVMICAALLRNDKEGYPGTYIGTDINPEAGWLLRPPYSAVGRLAYGDSIETLKRLEKPIDLFINDSDHSAEYEYREYQTIADGLSPAAVILGDNSHDIETAALTTDVTFIVVATPSEPGGGFSLRYVLPVCERIGQSLRRKDGYHLVVLTSTVMPGSTGGAVREALEYSSGKTVGKDFGLCYNPEFIALGSVVKDFLNPDFLLIGESDPQSGDILERIYHEVCDNRPPAARLSFIDAEIAKLAVNTYVTTKISFVNMLARICERLPGASVDAVSSAIGLDSRIGSKYLKGAVSYGGPCFPRDNVALIKLAEQVGAPPDIARATDLFNRAQIRWLADFVQQHLPDHGKAGILGLAYKIGRASCRERV